jgi:hypothetical protein
MLHVPREWLGGDPADWQEPGRGFAGPSQPRTYNDVGMHSMSLESVGFRARWGEHRPAVRREL